MRQTGGDGTEFQTKIQEAFQQAQAKAATRMKELEQEARKVLETLGDRAQAEFKVFLEFAQKGSREQIQILGVELEKLGKRLQELASKTETRTEPPPPSHPN